MVKDSYGLKLINLRTVKKIKLAIDAITLEEATNIDCETSGKVIPSLIPSLE
jgi:hypothetical protein